MNDRVLTRLVRCLCPFVLCGTLVTQTAWADDSDWEELQARRVGLLRELTVTVEHCIARSDTRYPIFHGCVDWHSAVHGHWALLRVHRVTKDERFLEIVQAALTPTAMREEHEFLVANPRFEMPYGRAWFLKLIQEYELSTGDEQYRYFGDAVAKTLRNYLVPRPCNLERPTYLNQAWAYRRLLEYYEHTGDSDRLLEVTTKVSVCRPPDVRFGNDHVKPEFFSVFGNLAHLLALTLDDAAFEHWHSTNNSSTESMIPVKKLGTAAHHLGINFARAWGMWSLYRRTGDVKYRKAYVANINQAMTLHEKSKDSYFKYGRWVPQFGIYAISASLVD